jgi:hypothetical protein
VDSNHLDTDRAYTRAFDRHCYVRNLTTGGSETVTNLTEAEQRRDELEATGVRVRITSAYNQPLYETPEG